MDKECLSAGSKQNISLKCDGGGAVLTKKS